MSNEINFKVLLRELNALQEKTKEHLLNTSDIHLFSVCGEKDGKILSIMHKDDYINDMAKATSIEKFNSITLEDIKSSRIMAEINGNVYGFSKKGALSLINLYRLNGNALKKFSIQRGVFLQHLLTSEVRQIKMIVRDDGDEMIGKTIGKTIVYIGTEKYAKFDGNYFVNALMVLQNEGVKMCDLSYTLSKTSVQISVKLPQLNHVMFGEKKYEAKLIFSSNNSGEGGINIRLQYISKKGIFTFDEENLQHSYLMNEERILDETRKIIGASRIKHFWKNVESHSKDIVLPIDDAMFKRIILEGICDSFTKVIPSFGKKRLSAWKYKFLDEFDYTRNVVNAFEIKEWFLRLSDIAINENEEMYKVPEETLSRFCMEYKEVLML